MVEIEIQVSQQAKLMLEQMKQINEQELIEWFIKVQKITIGGGDIVNYLQYLETKKV